MATTLTPVSQYTGSLVMADNGEDLDADVVQAVLQVLGDRAALAKDAALGLLRGAETFAVAPGGAAGAFSLTVGDIRALVLTCGDGVVRCLAATGPGQTVTQTSVEGGGATLGAAAAWWYVYAYAATTTVAYEVSTTAPTADLVWKTGSVGTKRYVGCFRTSGLGAPYPLRATRGRYAYRYSSITGGHTIANLIAAQAFTDLDLSAFIPPHARLAHLLVEAINGDADAGDELTVRVRTNGDTTASEGLTVPPAAVASLDSYARGTLYTEVETDASRLIEVEVSGSSGAPFANLYARGWQE